MKRLPPSPLSAGQPTPSRAGYQPDQNAYDAPAQAPGDAEQYVEPYVEPVPPPPVPTLGLRVATYNVRVDHTEDLGTVHDWPLRRLPVAASILSLGADLIAIQEPSPVQAQDLEVDLGPEWGVAVSSCDPDEWKRGDVNDGDARDGNGVVWRRSRLELLETSSFWLGPSPDTPTVGSAWGGSRYKRTCHVSRFRCKISQVVIAVYSTHFDHEGDDAPASGGSNARRMSAALVMSRALAATRGKAINEKKTARPTAEMVVVAGDFSTLLDREGQAYADLLNASEGELMDVRDCPGVFEVDCGRGSASWEGWENNPWSRTAAGPQRYDQIFVSRHIGVTRTSVAQEQYVVTDPNGQPQLVYASDHLPVTADLAIPRDRFKIPMSRRASLAVKGFKAGGRNLLMIASPSIILYLVILGIFFLGFVAILLFLLWEAVGGVNLECRFECRHKINDPPWDYGLCNTTSVSDLGSG